MLVVETLSCVFNRSPTFTDHVLQFFWKDKLVPVVGPGWDNPQDAFGSNNTKSIGQIGPAESGEEDGSAGLQ